MCFILLRPKQHITGLGPKSSVKDTRDQHIIGAALSFASSFSVRWVELSLTLGVNNTGKPRNDPVEFCHLCTCQEMEGGASARSPGWSYVSL